MITKQNFYFPLLVLIVTTLSLLNIGQYNLQEWDESRNGVNAFEMLHNGDYINYFYNKELDTWNAKPPLMIWLIVICYKIFGFNEFALRFTTSISTIIFFAFCFKLIELFYSSNKAFFCCMILLSCKAIFGNHIALTGDFDMLLTLFLIASVYYFILFIEHGKEYAVYFVALFTGLAFYTKGTASLVFIPGFVIYIMIYGKTLQMIKDRNAWLSILLFILIAGSWVLLVFAFGKSSAHSFYNSHNSIATMIMDDTLNRLTNKNFDIHNTHDNFYFFKVLDARFNLWNYVFYLSILIVIFQIINNRKNLKTQIELASNKILVLSFCLILPLSIILNFAANQHDWYMAPLFLFIAIIIFHGIYFISVKLKIMSYVFIVIFAFTFLRQVNYLLHLPNDMHYALSGNKKLQDQKIIVAADLKQNIFLYLKWLNTKVVQQGERENLVKYKNEILLIDKNKIDNAFRIHIENQIFFNEYCLGKIK